MAMRYRHLKQCSFNKDAVAVYRFVCYLICALFDTPLKSEYSTFLKCHVVVAQARYGLNAFESVL